MDREKLKPYAEWLKVGRVVRAGEKAPYYLVSPDRTHGLALFHEDQTSELIEPAIAGWVEIVPRDEWKAPKPPAPPKIRVRPHGTGLAVWCGPNREAIQILKRAGWRYDRGLNRWYHADRALERFADAMADAGFEVIVDG